jgi:hypothetical protein
MEYRAVKATSDYLESKPENVKASPMVTLVQELHTARRAKVAAEGRRRKLGASHGQ